MSAVACSSTGEPVRLCDFFRHFRMILGQGGCLKSFVDLNNYLKKRTQHQVRIREAFIEPLQFPLEQGYTCYQPAYINKKLRPIFQRLPYKKPSFVDSLLPQQFSDDKFLSAFQRTS